MDVEFFKFVYQIPFPPVDEMMMVTEHVIKERKYAIDAAIVCIMKHRKVLGHQQLVDECELQLSRFFKVLGHIIMHVMLW